VISSRRRHEVGLHHLHLVLARVGVALGGALVVVERDARRDDVDEGEALVGEAGLEERHQLALSPEKLRATNVAPSVSASSTLSMASIVLTSPFLLVEPGSAEAENWPLVRP
jgi:hypothetical protein